MKPNDWPTRNVELLQATMRHIELNPQFHDQKNWVNECGTAYCYAGHAAIISGASRPVQSLAWDTYWMIDRDTLKSVAVPHTQGYETSKFQAVDEFAAERLGITANEAEWLFEGDRTVEELRALVDAFCAGAWLDDDHMLHDFVVDNHTQNPVYLDDWFARDDD